MFAGVTVTYGLPISKGTFVTLAGAALSYGGSHCGQYLVTNLLKFVPGGNVAGGAIRTSVASALLPWPQARLGYRGPQRSRPNGPARLAKLDASEVRDIFMQAFERRAKRLPPNPDE